MGLANFIIKGRSQAVMVVSVFALLAFVLPPLIVVSGAALSLVALRNALSMTIAVVFLSLTVCTAVTWISGLSLMGLGPIAFWLMIVVVAEVLRCSRNLAVAILAGLLVVAVIVLLFFAWVPQPEQMWQDFIVKLLQMTDLGLPTVSVAQIALWAKLMTGALAAMGLITVVVSVLIGRWWQARLLESDGFQHEFHQLRLGRVLTIIALVLLILAVVIDSALWVALSALALVVYLFQGLAVIHAFVGQQASNKAWTIVLFYVMLVIFQQLVLLVSIVGIIDAWVDSRRRWLKIKPAKV